MNDAYEYLFLILVLSPLFFFIIAVGFRLLDNSALLFLQKEILVNSSNVSIDTIKHQIENHPDFNFKKQLKRALVFRRLHKLFLIGMLISFPFMVYQLISI